MGYINMKKEVSNNSQNPLYPTKRDVKSSASKFAKGIASAIMAASVTMGASGCGDKGIGKPLFEKKREAKPTETYEILGEMDAPPYTSEEIEVVGDEVAPTDEYELDGDVSEVIPEES